MEVKIEFTGSIVLKGKNMSEIMEKWEDCQLQCISDGEVSDIYAEEATDVSDNTDGSDLMEAWNSVYYQ